IRFITLLPCGRDQILVVTRENGVYLYNYNSGEVSASFISDFANTRLKEGLVSSAAIISGNRIAIGVEGGEGIYIFDFNGVLKQQISTGTAQIPRSAVTSMYCDYATNSQLWFCTAGCINRAYISLPVSEFGFSAGIVSIPGDIKQFNGAAYISCDSGIYRGFTDIEGHFRFALLEKFDRKTLELQNVRTANKKVLIASTRSGLFQVDTTGAVRIAFNNLYPTTIKVDRDDQAVIVAGSDRGIVSRLRYSGDRFVRVNTSKFNDINGSVVALEQSPEREWWVLTKNPVSLYRIKENPADTSFIRYGWRNGLRSDTLNQVVTIESNLYVCTGNGIYRYNPENELFEKDISLIGESFRDAEVLKIMKTPEGDIYVAGHDARFFDAVVTPTSQGHVVFRKQFDILPDMPTTDIEYIDGNIWIVKGKSLYVINKGRLGYNYGSFSTVFTNITAGGNLLLMNGSFYKEEVNGIKIPLLSQPEDIHPRLKYALNDISFSWTTTCYMEEVKTEYRYKLEGFDNDWSNWGNHNFKEFTNLPPGHYQFKIRSSTITGLGSKETTFIFSVLNPWYRTFFAVTIYI
ncbi:MAG: hypothetical protein IH593_00605, partial [Bacteroidales bacterium]|nr:hypothetical protein [Bacteroidales bacterium]